MERVTISPGAADLAAAELRRVATEPTLHDYKAQGAGDTMSERENRGRVGDDRTMTARQQRFVQEYLIDFNATQAAIRAGYSETTARQIGAENLTKPDIQQAITKAQAAMAEKVEVTREEIIRELKRLAFADMSAFSNWGARGVTLRDSSELSPDLTAAVAEIQETKVGVKIKLHDKKGALELLARHLGLLTDRVDINTTMEYKIVPPAEE